MVKYTASEECISAEDARFMAIALDEYIINQTKRGAYEGDIKSARIAKDAINFVLTRASLQYDDICFVVNAGTRNIPK
jgi:hypothetical protein